ncbi:MAG: sugar ABC transporter permease [Firmicutes bacterium]|nr:sugar ABC transporter permease [Bacillota bacterium]
MSNGLSRLRKKEAIEFYLFISPWIIGFLLFLGGPIVASAVLSFTDWNLLNPPSWVGVDNYLTIFTDDDMFWQSLKVTAIYTGASVPLGLMLSLLLALLLNTEVRGVRLFRTIYYLPSVMSGVAVALLWSWLFNPDFGLVNHLLGLFGIPGPTWLASETWALPAMIIMSLWGAGQSMLIFLAGLQGIPQQLYEAAEIDGASGWSRFVHVTLPMLSPVILFNLIMGIIGSFQVFTQGYIMTNGGPNNATLFYVLNLYNQAFRNLRMGYASALAWILFFIILGLTLLVIRESRERVYYEGEVR